MGGGGNRTPRYNDEDLNLQSMKYKLNLHVCKKHVHRKQAKETRELINLFIHFHSSEMFSL